MTVRALMIQGTGSGVGKSLIAAGLCRIFARRGIRVAPFKAQNMALNSFVTREGAEMGRAQALQAEACGIEPHVAMNPVLLKASGEAGAQVILNGVVHSTMPARDYYLFRDQAWKTVTDAWHTLSRTCELIIIEGAGSPAEINLMDKEIVNMAIARYTGAPVLLAGDIDRGGVFASLYGTVALLGDDGARIKGFIINKFRGDRSILEPGNQMILQKTAIPVIGVLPYLTNIGLSEEDGMALERPTIRSKEPGPHTLTIVVVRLKYISNFTDFDPFLCEPDVDLVFSSNPGDLLRADLIIIPGSKNTVKDLLLLRAAGLEEVLVEAKNRGIPVIGICGGYQMLGQSIEDPHRIESEALHTRGLAFLPVRTVFNPTKTTCRVIADMAAPLSLIPHRVQAINGYEIHMGQIEGATGVFTVRSFSGDTSCLEGAQEGAVWGTSLHGIFENDRFRGALIAGLVQRKGRTRTCQGGNYNRMKTEALDRLADVMTEYLDMKYIDALLEGAPGAKAQ